MSIIRMGRTQDVTLEMGAYCPLEWNTTQEVFRKFGKELVLWEEFQGQCLFEREANYYDDSDFYMTVWDDTTHSAREIQFATTRGWSYPCMASHPDATDDVRAKYDAWKAEQDRRWSIQQRWNARKQVREYAKAWGVDYFQAKRIASAYKERGMFGVLRVHDGIDKLLRTKKFRSEFRASLARQVRDWSAEREPRYRTPLSSKQFGYL